MLNTSSSPTIKINIQIICYTKMAASCESMVRSFFVKILLKIFAIPYIIYINLI